MEHLIPDSWFAGRSIPALLLIIAVALAVLSKAADELVETATDFALKVGLPKVIIGATILSLGTTAPECAVSVAGAVEGDGGLALGNAVGSVIFDTAVIFGGLCLLTRLPADRFILARQGWVQFGSAVLLAAACYLFYARDGLDAQLPGWFGGVLLVLLAAYLAVSVRWAQQHKAAADASPDVRDEAEPGEVADAVPNHGSDRSLAWLLGLMLVALVVVILSGRFVVAAAVETATQLSVPEHVIAATLVAFGTSLPELVVGVKAVQRGHGEILVGNVVGADILNILFVAGASAVGAAAAGQPLRLVGDDGQMQFLTVQIPMMLLALVYFRACIWKACRQGAFDRWMGGPLLLIYAIGTALQFVSTG